MLRQTNVPASAFMLADHLDAALAAGEDILAAGARLESDAGALEPVALRSAVELVRALELSIVTRVLKAREWSQRLVAVDPRFRLQASLFMGGTAALVDALAEFADATNLDFDTADSPTPYFRSRGVIDEEAEGLWVRQGALITEQFRIARRIELGPLMDMIAAYLDAMEIHFELFAPEGGAPTETTDDADEGEADANTAPPAALKYPEAVDAPI